ncbi:hypothetical protein QUR79_05780 [Arcobacter cryaerophilus gv. pseudocryaerophilus]|uniref:Uncharacterized protein n=2 Tax=Arcobacteraceae TaxID=2808963 RepID=A0AAU0P209_9BACT|nr:hypothetical protein RJG54_02530 [Arcobacter sp. AZ-2023]WPD02259.1 hypothetical protein QUR79_05780 [Arcobacter sp. DSM 115972]
MQNTMSIPSQRNYNKIWGDFKISFFSSYSLETWKEELINIDSVTYEFIKDDVEELFYKTGGYIKYLDFESIYRLSIEVTASQVLKNIKKNKNIFFERDNINTLDKYYLIKQRICNNCKNVFDKNRKINVVFLQTMILDEIYENYEVDFSVIDIQKISKYEPNKLIFAINLLLKNYDLTYEEAQELSEKYNIDKSNFSSYYFSKQFKILKKQSNNQICIDFYDEEREVA